MRIFLRAVRGALALAVLAAVLGAVPWLLADTLGIPWPRPVPTSFGQIGPWLAIWRIDRARFVLDLLGIVGWGYWAAFVRQLIVQAPGALADAIATARHTAPAVRTRRAGPAASFVAVLLATAAMSVALARSPAAAKTGGQYAPPTPPVTISAPASPAAAPAPAARARHVVVKGDTLWDIAADQLGDAQRWHEIYDLNCARVQDDGQRLEDPNVILPGWTLTLPTVDSAPPSPETAVPAPAAPTTTSNAAPAPQAEQEVHSPVTHKVLSTRAHRDRTFVVLPDGGLVGIGLAGALAAFIALARKRRRIRSTVRWPIPLDTPTPAAPAPVAAIERAHLATLAPPALGYIQDGDLDAEVDDPYLSPLDDAEPAEIPTPAPTTAAVPHRSGLAGPSIPAAYAAFTAVGALAFGTDGDREIRLDLRAHAGLGLTGAGAADAARALLVGIAANGGPLPSLDHMRILAPSADLMALLNGALPNIPRLEVTEDLDTAVDLLETEYLDRRRVLGELSVRDAAGVRRFYPDRTLEPIVLIAAPGPAAAPRLAALLEAGRAADLHAILLGPWESGTTVHIDSDGHTSGADETLNGATAFTLSTNEAEALLAQLRNDDATAEAADDRQEEDDQPAPEQTHLAVVPAPHGEIAPLPLAPRVSVNVLGSFMVTADHREIVLNNKETSVVLFLALHPAGATRAEIIEALWTSPDGTNTGTPETLRSTLHNVRDRIRAATGDKKRMYIAHRANRYLLDPADVSTDIARFHQHLDTANRTQDSAERIASLEAAVDCYHDHLGAGIIADWLIVDREAESRRFGDACARLADLTVDTRPEFALYILERAVADADCNQELYRKIMETQARLGRYAEMWKTLRLLEVRLAALEDEPDRDLYELANRLTARQAV